MAQQVNHLSPKQDGRSLIPETGLWRVGAEQRGDCSCCISETGKGWNLPAAHSRGPWHTEMDLSGGERARRLGTVNGLPRLRVRREKP